jgi:hypothetical protein
MKVRRRQKQQRLSQACSALCSVEENKMVKIDSFFLLEPFLDEDKESER